MSQKLIDERYVICGRLLNKNYTIVKGYYVQNRQIRWKYDQMFP